jgi:hypothetical protein
LATTTIELDWRHGEIVCDTEWRHGEIACDTEMIVELEALDNKYIQR